jgi:hypothetical protein
MTYGADARVCLDRTTCPLPRIEGSGQRWVCTRCGRGWYLGGHTELNMAFWLTDSRPGDPDHYL